MKIKQTLACLAFVISYTAASLYEGFPFDEQLPPVARVGTEFTYQLDNETYLSSEGTIAYSIEDAPSWLEFDTGSRTLYGTPNDSDVSDSVKFTLVGNDSDSSIAKEYSLVVSNSTGPQPSTQYTVLSQLTEFGQTNGVNGLVLSPGEVFNVTFDKNTFDDSDDDIVAYYGRSSDRTPLPNWLFFDSANLKFSGVAPAVNSEIAPGFQYSFIFIASDYAGFTGSSVDFDIIVGAHELTTDLKNVIKINGSSTDTIDYEIPLGDVFEDGEPVTLANISNIVITNNPDWLSLDNYTLKGTVPEDYTSSNSSEFEVLIYDTYGNGVTLYFEVQTIDSLFAVDSFNFANATRGEYFQYYFVKADFTDYDSTNITLDLGDDGDWLDFHVSNLTISGETPDDFDDTEITVIASNSDEKDDLSFKIYGVDPLTTSSSSSSRSSRRHSSSSKSSSKSSSSMSSSSSSSSSAAAIIPVATTSSTSAPIAVSKQSKSSNSKAVAIGCGVAIPLFVLIVAGLLLFFCCYKKRSKDSQDEEQKSSSSPQISKPILGNPANGPNQRSPNGGSGGDVDSGSSINDYYDEKSEFGEPTRLGALNAMKLDDKDLYDNSDHSSTTNVDTSFGTLRDDTHSSLYHDALQAQSTDMLMPEEPQEAVPKKSWRRTYDPNYKYNNRESMNSLASVSTNELFSIRLADDDNIKRDPRKSNLGLRDSAFLGSTTSSILSRDDSGNIHRLDSDGNIADIDHADESNRVSKGRELGVLAEEPSHNNLEVPNTSIQYSMMNDTSFSTNHSQSTGEEFYPVTTKEGIKWEQNGTKFSFDNSHDSSTISKQNSTKIKARLVDFTNKGTVSDTSNDITQSTGGETAEIESV